MHLGLLRPVAIGVAGEAVGQLALGPVLALPAGLLVLALALGLLVLGVLGPLPDETAGPVARLGTRPHAHVLGEVPYAELPAALQGLDVALIPFRAGDPYTVGINPNKLYQYWAAGLPIVASPMADVAADGVALRFAGTPETFERAVLETLAHPADRAAVRERARGFDWDDRADRLDGLLRAALAAKETNGRVTSADVARFGEDVPTA